MTKLGEGEFSGVIWGQINLYCEKAGRVVSLIGLKWTLSNSTDGGVRPHSYHVSLDYRRRNTGWYKGKKEEYRGIQRNIDEYSEIQRNTTAFLSHIFR